MTRERLEQLAKGAKDRWLNERDVAEIVSELERCWSRITELQEHNNGEVEKRRALERQVKTLRLLCDSQQNTMAFMHECHLQAEKDRK